MSLSGWSEASTAAGNTPAFNVVFGVKKAHVDSKDTARPENTKPAPVADADTTGKKEQGGPAQDKMPGAASPGQHYHTLDATGRRHRDSAAGEPARLSGASTPSAEPKPGGWGIRGLPERHGAARDTSSLTVRSTAKHTRKSVLHKTAKVAAAHKARARKGATGRPAAEEQASAGEEPEPERLSVSRQVSRTYIYMHVYRAAVTYIHIHAHLSLSLSFYVSIYLSIYLYETCI